MRSHGGGGPAEAQWIFDRLMGGFNAQNMQNMQQGNFGFGFPGAGAGGPHDPFGGFGFNNGNFGQGFQQPAAGSNERPPSDDKVPPAGAKALRQLPQVIVSQEDLEDDDTNAECAICLRDQALGDTVSKLPCGHIFCPGCVTDWLKRNCTCPVCRYELETDNTKFEAGRKERMSMRKGRYRLRELRGMPPGNLSALARSLDVNIDGCVSKDELVQRLVDSGKIEIMPSGPAPTYSRLQLKQMGVTPLKKLMLSLGVQPPPEAIEKDDLVSALCISGRIEVSEEVLEEDNSGEAAPSGYGNCRSPGYCTWRSELDPVGGNLEGSAPMDVDVEKVPTYSRVEETPAEPAEFQLGRDELLKKSVGELKKMLKDKNLSLQGCLEKGDMVQRLLDAR